MKIIKTLTFYIFLFFLFHFESRQIGPITLSQLWKIPFFVYLFWQVLVIRRMYKISFIKWSYARAVKNLVAGGFSASYVAGILDFIRYMMFPLMFEFVKCKVKSIKRLDYLLVGFAQFVIISGIPFVSGLLKSNGKIIFELDNFNSYTGMFQGPHAASITTATSVLILLAFLKSKSEIIRYPKLNYLLLLFGIYLIYLTYVRTGYAMFAVGLIILFMPQKLSFKQIFGSIVAISFLIFGFIYLLETNEFFYNRIFDIRNGHETAAGSGRLEFWAGAVDFWYKGSFFEIFFGSGLEALLDYMYSLTGNRVYAHNELFTQLGQNGLLGVFIFIGYLISLFRFIKARNKRPSYKLALAIFALYVSLMMTQGGMWFHLDVFMALVYVKLEFEHILYKRKKTLNKLNVVPKR